MHPIPATILLLTLTACASKPPTEPPVRIVERLVTLKCPIQGDLLECPPRPVKPDLATATDSDAGTWIVDDDAAGNECRVKLGKVASQIASCNKPD